MNRLAQTYKSPLSTKATFVPVAGLFLLLLPFQVWQGLFFATQTSKVLFLGWSVVGFVVIGGVYYFFTGKQERLTFTATDLLLSLVLLYMGVHAVWIKPVQLNRLFVPQWLAFAALYIVCRRIEAHHRTVIDHFCNGNRYCPSYLWEPTTTLVAIQPMAWGFTSISR